MEQIINDYNRVLTECHSYFQNGEKGMIRSSMGSMVERWVTMIFDEINSNFGGIGEIKNGHADRIPITNEYGTTIGMQVDRHMYINGELKCIIECKSWLDRCMMIRANDDIGRIKKYKEDVKGYIFSLENCVSSNSEQFIMEEGILDGVFYLTDGKHSGTKQVWFPEHYKPLNESKLWEFYNMVVGLFEESQS